MTRDVRLIALVMVMFAVSCTGTKVTTEPTPSSSRGSYTDPKFGWTVTAQPSLSSHAFGTPDPQLRGDVSGVAVANFSTDAVPSGDGLQPLRRFPATGVLFMLWENAPGPVFVNASDDTPLPLSLTGYRRVEPYVGGSEPVPMFRPLIEGGGSFASTVWIGPQASDADRRAIQETVVSVTFLHLVPFTISPLSTAIVLEPASSYPVGSVTPYTRAMLRPVGPSISDFGSSLTDVGFFLVHGPGGFYAVPMSAQSPQTQRTCHVSADPKDVSFSCPNGARWDRYVRVVAPPANQGEIHGYWLFVAPATVSWDGQVLVNEGNDPPVA